MSAVRARISRVATAIPETASVATGRTRISGASSGEPPSGTMDTCGSRPGPAASAHSRRVARTNSGSPATSSVPVETAWSTGPPARIPAASPATTATGTVTASASAASSRLCGSRAPTTSVTGRAPR